MNIDKLFRFEKIEGGYILTEFSQKDYFDDEKTKIISEITLPANHRLRPVVEIGKDAFRSAWHLQKLTIPEGVRRIGESAFQNCKNLRSVSLPSSLEELCNWSFMFCAKLREVEFNSEPNFGEFVFSNDFALPAELILTGLVCSRDLTRPLNKLMLDNEISLQNAPGAFRMTFCERPDVFELAAKNGCLANADTVSLFKIFIDKERFDLLRIAERYGLLDRAELIDKLTAYCADNNKTELAAYFLELKKRKFGFNGDDKFEL